nr:hypothetical transcript [Hymenolepis microstoma]
MNRRLQRLEEAQTHQAEPSAHLETMEGQDQISLEINFVDDDLEKLNHNVDITSDSEGVMAKNELPPLSFHSDDDSDEDKDYQGVSTQVHNAATADVPEPDENDEGQEWLPSCLEDGDDMKTTKDIFHDLQEAFSGTNPTLLSAQVNKDLCRRLTTLYDKGLTADANDLINYVYDMYAVGKVEIYLVQPNKMSQVREVSDEDQEGGTEKEKANNSNPHTSKITPLDENDNNEEGLKGAVLERDEDEKSEKDLGDEELGDGNQSNMKWKKKLDIADPKVNDEQPLVSYDILIDPEIFVNWNPKGKKGGKS